MRRKLMKNTTAYKVAALLTAGCLLAACGAEGTDGQDTEAQSASAASSDELQNLAGEPAAASAAPEAEIFDAAAVSTVIPSKKEEIVSVRADASGKPEKIEVSGTLSGFAGEKDTYVRDASGLDGLKNVRGEEEYYIAENGEVYWQNLGEDIQYEGISEGELPVDVRVSYYLDGEERTPEQMAGKSGEVKIRFDYTNKTRQKTEMNGEEQEMTVPFLALSMAALPEDKFTDVEISNGKIVMLNGERAALGYALTGLREDLNLDAHEQTKDIDLPSYVEITAQAEDFSLDFTATILTSGLFRDLDTAKLDDLDETVGDMDELQNAAGDMSEAAGKLADGMAEMQGYLTQYVSGVNSVAGAVGQINTELAGQDLTQLSQLQEGLRQAAGAAEMSDALRQAASLSQLGTSLEQTAQLAALAEPLEAAAGYASLADPVAATASLADLGTYLQNLSSLNDLAAQLEAAAAADPESAELAALAGWAANLRQMAGVAEWSESLQQMAQLSGYADTLRQASDLAAYADPVRQLSGFSEGAQALQQLSSLTELADGLSQLSSLGEAAESIGQLQTGMQQLKDGIAQLNQGTAQLPAAGKGLTDGMAGLTSGAAEFREGIKEFDEEAIQELVDFFKVDLKDLTGRIRAVSQADREYGGFTPSLEGQEVTTVFLIETGEIA